MKLFAFALLGALAGCSGVRIANPTPSIEDRPIHFPQDERKHSHAWVEWWYFTGRLRDQNERGYGFELAFFKVNQGLRIFKEFSADMLYFAHFAISDGTEKRHQEAEINLIPLFSKVRVEEGRLGLRYDDWGAESESLFYYHIWAREKKMALDLYLRAICDPILGEGDGRIEMGDKGVSYYYTFPRLQSKGTVVIDGESLSVSGLAWMDHQWGDYGWYSPYGWNWWGLNLEDGTNLIIYSLPVEELAIERTVAII